MWLLLFLAWILSSAALHGDRHAGWMAQAQLSEYLPRPFQGIQGQHIVHNEVVGLNRCYHLCIEFLIA